MSKKRKKRKRPHKKIRKTDGQSRKNKFIIVALCFLFITAFIFYYSSRDKETNFISSDISPYEVFFHKEGELVFIDTVSQEILKEIDIEIADTAYEKKQGLMFRKSMQEDQGMLFIYEKEDLRGMWMKNTYISLDIVFINEKYEIIRIYKNTLPLSTKPMFSYEDAMYVVEVVAGFCDTYKIKEADRVSFKHITKKNPIDK